MPHWNRLSPKQKADEVKRQLNQAYEQALSTLELMDQKGNTSSECQKLAVLQALNAFEHTINGISADDFEDLRHEHHC